MAYLDDQSAVPVQQKFLDFLAVKPQTKEEVHSAMRKVPEMKLRPEKIADDVDVVYISSSKSGDDFPYMDPIPSSMVHVDIRELSSVDIDWKMLTLKRPDNPAEIHIFNSVLGTNKLDVRRKKKIRLRTKGRYKNPHDSDADRSDEFTYDFFSRLFGVNKGDQGGDDIPKPPPPVETKADPAQPTEDSLTKASVVEKVEKPLHLFRSKKRKTNLRRKKGKKKKKGGKKPKLLKKKTTSMRLKSRQVMAKLSKTSSSKDKTVDGGAKSTAGQLKPTKEQTRSTVLNQKSTTGQAKSTSAPNKRYSKSLTKRKSEQGKTLVQILKASEKHEKRKSKPNS